MIPTSGALSALTGKSFTLDPRLVARADEGAGVRSLSWAATLSTDGGGATLTRADDGGGDAGLWVPYMETRAVIGFASGGQTWAASGPFSGCEFAVGKAGDGRVFAAHVARQSGSTGPEDFQKAFTAEKLSVWYWNRVPLPSDTFYSCSYLFAQFGGTGLLGLVRVDVKVKSMGGGSGEVFNVKVMK